MKMSTNQQAVSSFLNLYTMPKHGSLAPHRELSFMARISKPFKKSAPSGAWENPESSISQVLRHVTAVEENHHKSNLVFKKTRSLGNSNLVSEAQPCQIHPVGSSNLTVTRKPECGPESTSTNFDMINAEDLETISEEVHKILRSKRLLKDFSFREATIPGTYIAEEAFDLEDCSSILKDGNADGLLVMATQSKESSISLQCFISECRQSNLNLLASMMKEYFLDLITDKFGSFVLQRLLTNHQPSFAALEQICAANFNELACNQYSSRVIQLLIEKSKSFCDLALSFFEQSFELAVTSSSACHLLVSAIKNAHSAQASDFVLSYLRKSPALIGNKFFYRVLLTYVCHGDDSQLEKAATALGLKNRVVKYFNRKAAYAVVLAFLQRNHAPTIGAVCDHLAANPQQLLETRYFASCMQKLWQEKNAAVTAPVFDSLMALPVPVLEKIGKKPDTLNLLVFIMINCCKDSQKSRTAEFLKQPFARSLLAKVTSRTAGKLGIQKDPVHSRTRCCLPS